MGAPMPGWEYITLDLNDLPCNGDEIDILNDIGHEGWELVVITCNKIAYLKRMMPGRAARPAASKRAPKSATATKE
jgi:hypothetical protein